MMRLLASALVAALTFLGTAAAVPAQALDTAEGQLVRESPAAGTPHVLNGRVLSIAQVGNTMILGGTFDSVRNDGSNTQLSRNSLMAFNATTGEISTTFLPEPNGNVNVVIPAGDGESVYVGGTFTSIGGQTRRRVARIRVSDGQVISQFNAGGVSGAVKDLRLKDGRLWMAGGFTHVGGQAQTALATVNPTTGDFLPFMGLSVSGVHNDGNTNIAKIDVTPDGSRLVAVGNFNALSGVSTRQLFMLDLTGASATQAPFRTDFYAPACAARAFDTYMRDVDFSPDGSFFVVSTTGAYGGSSAPCDTTARWETNSGSIAQPSWIDTTGGDTTYGVEITDSAVYVGGHFRWQNNSFAGDRAGQGAIAREGIAALDPVNGMPLDWNPTRTRGVGVFDFYVNDQGLWVASDTDRIGNFVLKSRIALLPLAGGKSIPAVSTPKLPNDVYVAGGTGADLVRRSLNNGEVGATTPVATGPVSWGSVRGAFMLNGNLYLASQGGSFTRMSFDGNSYGASVPVNTQDQIVALTDWRNDINSMTGMFFDSGRIYFTLSGSNTLYYRYFTPSSDAVGARRYVATGGLAGVDFSQVRGMFGTGNQFFWATPDGRLNRMDWTHQEASGKPVAGTAVQISGPGIDSNLWNSRSLFLYQDADGDVAPGPATADFDSSCDGRDCVFDGSASTAPGSSIDSYDWDFGDGSQGNGVNPSHTFAADGSYDVELTVHTSDGGSATVAKEVTVEHVNGAPVATFEVSCTDLSCQFDASGSSDPDGDGLTYSWDFGDGAAGTGVSPEHAYDSPGSRTVTLTVSDGSLSNATTRVAQPTDGEDPAEVSFVGASSESGNLVNHRVDVPSDVAAGDTLVLFLTTNIDVSTESLAGWTLRESVSGNGVAGWAWTRQAAAGDAGQTITVTTSQRTKSTMSVAAYRGSDGSAYLGSAQALQNSSSTSHTTPTLSAPDGAWLVSYWSAKSPSSVTWALPSGVENRAESAGTGGGNIKGLVADSDGPVSGSVGGLTATTEAVQRSVMFSVVVGQP